MRNTIGNEILPILSGLLGIVAELEDWMLEARINLVTKWVSFKQIITASDIER